MFELYLHDKRFSRSVFIKYIGTKFGNESGFLRGAPLNGEQIIAHNGVHIGTARFKGGLLHGGIDPKTYKPRPAAVLDGHEEWWENGIPHRHDGPAVISESGGWKEYWSHGELGLIRSENEITVNPEYEFINEPLGALAKREAEKQKKPKELPFEEQKDEKTNGNIQIIKIFDYLKDVEIKTVKDFEYNLKYLVGNYPDVYGNDSMKCAHHILYKSKEFDVENVDGELFKRGCTTIENTRKAFDKLAGINQEKDIEMKSEKQNLIER